MPTSDLNTCTSCFKGFGTTSALRSHCRAKGHPFCVCESCERSFGSEKALSDHLNSPRHRVDDDSEDDTESEEESEDEEETYCDGCSRNFVDTAALNRHRLDSPKHNWCFECSRDFSSAGALDQHTRDSPRHRFEGESDYDSSSDSESEGEIHCSGCNRDFVDSTALNQHRIYSPKHNWCFACSRDFSTADGLDKHVNSLAHQDRIFKCPFCQSMFKSPSGIALHIESGCHKLSRHHVTAAVRSMKIVPNIVIKRITGGQSSVPTTVKTFIATEASFNGTSYTCYICRKKCQTLAGLNSHLNSAAHDDDEFRCPKCKAEFKLISGFVQHLESRSCGLSKDKQVEKYYNSLADNFSRLLKM